MYLFIETSSNANAPITERNKVEEWSGIWVRKGGWKGG
jgi:hypothetical protein